MQFLLGVSVQMCFNINNTLLIDINHTTPATAQASSNIIRCALAAVAVAVFQDIINAIGEGWTFTLLGALCSVSAALYWVDREKGMVWRTANVLNAGNEGALPEGYRAEDGEEMIVREHKKRVETEGNEGETDVGDGGAVKDVEKMTCSQG